MKKITKKRIESFLTDETYTAAVLSGLTDLERIVIEGIYFKGLSEERICHLLHDEPVPMQTVRKLHNSGMKKVKESYLFVEEMEMDNTETILSQFNRSIPGSVFLQINCCE